MNFVSYTYRLVRVLLYSVYKGSFFKEGIQLKTVNQSCCIIGNGPSLIHQLESSDFLYKQEDLFVVNNFVLTDYYQKIKPNNYVFADPCYWDSNCHKEEFLKSQDILKKIAKETNWEMNIIAPMNAEICFKNHFKNHSKIKLHFFKAKTLNPLYKKISHYLYSKDIICPEYQNVLILTSFLALNIGFKQINLFGAEHSWTESIRVNSFNQVCLQDKHFYELEAKLLPWINVKGDVYKMHEILVDLSKMFQGYYYILDYSKFKQATIFNCTPNSYIDAFKRKEV